MQLSISLLLLFTGLLFAAWRSKSGEKNPLLTLGGLVLVFVALLTYLFSGQSLPVLARSLFVDAGLAMLAVGLLLALRRGNARSFFVLGVMMLGLGLAVAFVLRLFGGPHAPGDAAPEAPPAVAAEGTAEGTAEGEEEVSFLVELGPDDRIEEIAPLLADYDARYERAFPTISLQADEDLAQYFIVYVKRKLREKLMELLGEDDENVDFVEENRTVALAPPIEGEAGADRAPGVVANDPLAAEQWGLAAIGGHAVHAALRDVTPRRKAVVAILDTGVDAAHEDLDGVFGTSPGTTDAHGHGTHCAGIAAAATNNGRGVASLNWEGRFIEVVSFQALPLGGAGTFETIAQAILDATEARADVISMSLGDVAPVPPRVIEEAVRYALRRGAIVVASAGNANQDAGNHTPSNIDGVISVAAVGRDLKKARFSNTNTSLARPIAAPGVDILSLKPNGVYAPLSGTSMATPMVAGLLGVLRALSPELSAGDAYALLHRTGRTVEDTPLVGRVIDAEAALRGLSTAAPAANAATAETPVRGKERDYRADVE